jgi:hypothetical protein
LRWLAGIPMSIATAIYFLLADSASADRDALSSPLR